jgi:hypothetical protein
MITVKHGMISRKLDIKDTNCHTSGNSKRRNDLFEVSWTIWPVFVETS